MFSSRKLSIAISLWVFILSALATPERVHATDSELLAELKRKHCKCYFNHDGDLNWVDLLEGASAELLSQVCKVTTLEHLTIIGRHLAPADFAHLSMANSLTSLEMVNSSFDDTCIAYVSKLASLEGIYFRHCDITGEEIARLKNLPRLREFSFESCPIKESNLKFISELTHLEKLWIIHCPVSGEGFRDLSRLKKLSRIILDKSPITSKGLKTLRRHPSLKSVSLSNTSVSDGAITHSLFAQFYQEN